MIQYDGNVNLAWVGGKPSVSTFALVGQLRHNSSKENWTQYANAQYQPQVGEETERPYE